MQERVNIFRNADVYNSSACIHDSRLGYYIDWTENNNLNGYSVVDGITSHTTWDGVYFGVSMSGSCYISQDSDISIDASDYNLVKINMRLDRGQNINGPSLGRIEFQTSSESTWSSTKSVNFSVNSDNSYREYLVDMSTHLKWEGTVTRFRLYPMTDGEEGIKVHLKGIKIESRTKYACDSFLQPSVCSRYAQYSHQCPWIGSPGSSVSDTIDNGITIQSGINDRLLVNIDGYGNQAITLREVVSAQISDIARDIQDKLNLIGVGGYALARCYEDDFKIRIESDWHSSDSSVVVSEPSNGSCGKTLGFFNSAGNKIATEENGSDSASLYERAPLQLSSSSIKYLKNTSGFADKGAFSIEADSYSPQSGYFGYRDVVKDTKIEFRNKTLIDYDNPVNSNGVISFVGYSGDSYSNTEFRVYRQRLDGSLHLVSHLDMSSTVDVEDQIFEESTNIQVKKGDLISLYSAALHTGSSNRLGNFSYILYDGDMPSNTAVQPLLGKGETGLPLFARGSRKNNQASLEIEFDRAQLVESIVVNAEKESVVEEVNLCTLRNGGVDGGPHITGTTGVDTEGTQAPDMEDISALIDGDKQDINGTSSYCYPGWLDLPITEHSKYSYTDFQLAFDFALGLNVYFPIYKIKMYFVEKKNIKSFRWEIPIMTNPQDTNRIWGVGWDRYSQVYTDEGIMDSDSIYLYNNPALVVAGDYQLAYSHLNYKYLELVFDAFDARSIRYNATLGDSPETDMSQLTYSYFPIADSPKIQEIEIFSKSLPSTNITSNFTILSANESGVYLTHTNIDEISSTSAKCIIGRPTSKLKLDLFSEYKMKIFDIYAVLSEDPVKIETNYNDTVALNAPIDSPESTSEIITITNDSTDISNFYIDILDEDSKSERCILWNRMSNADYLLESEIGPGGIVRRRNSRYLRPYNYAYNCPGYYLDSNFVFGNTSYISLDGMSTWTSIGATISDGSQTTFVTNENPVFYLYPTVYVALNLENNYNISSVDVLAPDGESVWASSILYSSNSTDNPSNIPLDPDNPNGWGIGFRTTAKWVLFQSSACAVGSESVKYMSGVSVNVDFTHSYNFGKAPWKSASGYLTNGKMGKTSVGTEEGWVYNGQAEYFCVNLGWWHRITNVIVGPLGDAVTSVQDVDAVEPGSWPSIVDSYGAGSDVAYSNSSTDNPAEVVWGSFGDAPNSPVKWVMVKTSTRIEEIIVHTDDNEPNNKKSFLNDVWFSSAGTLLYKEFVETRSGICAISMDYPESAGKKEEYILYKQCLGYDEELAKRDALGFWLYVSDVSQLDPSYGYISLGTSKTQDNGPLDINLDIDEYNQYKWNFSGIYSIIKDGWNYLSLPFSDNYKVGYLYIAEDDRSKINSTDTTTRDRIKYIKFAFRGAEEDNSPTTIRMDDFKIIRRNFTSTLFDGGAYIPKSEYIKFPLNDFNPFKGTIEFFIRADWTRSLICNSCSDPRDHSIVRVYSTEDDYLLGLFMTGQGLQFYLSDGVDNLMLTDNSRYKILRDVPTHLAITWDLNNEYGTAPFMGIYVNGVLSVAYEKSDIYEYGVEFSSLAQRSLYTLLLGAKAWDGLISPFSSSVDGAIDNIKVYNYPVQDFSYSIVNEGVYQAKRGSEVIQISLDGINYYSIKDRGTNLPLFKQNVSVGSDFGVYVSGLDLDKTKDGEKNRKSFITVTRTPV